MIAAAPVAAPVAADAAMQSAATMPSPEYANKAMAAGLVGGPSVDPNWKQNRIKNLIEEFNRAKKEPINADYTLDQRSIDYDILEMKSFSMSTKMRMQRERNAIRVRRKRLNDILRELWYSNDRQGDLFDPVELAKQFGLML